jgi:GH15 family glucan-1,4-alpha-glucosidase
MSRPIADYGLLSDCQSSALVAKDGSIDWLCIPRFDSPAVCARLLDEDGGCWELRPVEEASVTRRYLDDSMALETTFTTSTGEVTVTDALAMAAAHRHHDLGRNSQHLLLRVVRGVAGRVEMHFYCRPRPEFGLVMPLSVVVPGGIVFRGGAVRLALSSPVPLKAVLGGARARVVVEEGSELGFALQHSPTWDEVSPTLSNDEVTAALEETVHAWQGWAEAHVNYKDPWGEEVRFSGRVLQALTYAPTGAMIAAPTTSLPENPGGVRNWDYRYSWVRDASLTLHAMWVAACPDEVHRFFSWMVFAAAGDLARERPLQIMYGVGGERDLSERSLEHLGGWEGSRPVRVGNGAWSQRQNDVFGHLLDAALLYREELPRLAPEVRRFFTEVADAAASVWETPDHGIWEVRDDPRHFLSSKLLCWVALDRAAQLAADLDAADRAPEWRDEAEKIRKAILEEGWNKRVGAFTQAFGREELDASVLLISICGFLEPRDPAVLATIDAVERELLDERGLVMRYLAPDGLRGDEGSFLLCTFWLAEALAMADEIDRAIALIDRVLAHANDLGLFSEEVSPDGALLGNFPQAFSHVGLIHAAYAVGEAQKRAGQGSAT